jgi:hypothetical protein
VSIKCGVPKTSGRLKLNNGDGGKVIGISTLMKLSGKEEGGNGDSKDDAGECNSNVLASNNWSISLCICNKGHQIGTLYIRHGI